MILNTRLGGFKTVSITLFLELMAFYSIMLIISHTILHQPSVYIVGAMWVGGVCGTVITLLLGTTRRGLILLCILFAGVVVFTIIGQFNVGIRGWLLWFIVTLAAFRGNQLCKLGSRSYFLSKYQSLGIVCTLILSMFSTKLLLSVLDAGSLYAAGLISLCAWLLRLNSEQVQKETLRDKSSQRGALRGFVSVNRRWSILVVVVMLIFGSFSQLSQGFYWLWNQFTAWLNNVLSNTEQPANTMEPQPEVAPNLFPMGGEPSNDAGNPIWLAIFSWVVGITVALFAIYVMVKLVRLVILKIGHLVARLRSIQGLAPSRVPKIDIYYQDKIEKIETKRRLNLFRRKKKIVPQDAHGKVRYYYQTMIRRAIEHGLAYSSSQTPNEIVCELKEKTEREVIITASVAEEMTSLYNDVRYGDKVLEERQLEQVLERLKNSIGK